MTPERWQRVTDLFSAVLECDPVAREALLQQMCSGDPELRSEVERLLSSDDQASAHDFLRSSTLAGPDRSPDNPVRKIMENLEFRIDAPTPARDKRPEKPASEMPTLSQEAHWGLVTSAQAGDSAQARWALAEFCKNYWYPLYAYIRRSGYSTEQAQELTYGFFLALLEHDFLKTVDQQRGKLRSVLLASCRYYLIDERGDQRAEKRGQGLVMLNIHPDEAEARYAREPADTMTPEQLFDRCWTFTLLDRVLDRLKCDYANAGKRLLFDRLVGTFLRGSQTASYADLASELKMSEGAVKVAAHRLRHRHRELVRDEVHRTVATPEDVDDEIRTLLNSLIR